MCRKISVRGVTIGEGRPKICIPLAGRSLEELLRQAAAAQALGGDLYEWRMDCFDSLTELSAAGRALRAALPDAPLLFTFRTAAEGGQKPLGQADYLALCRETAEAGYCDLIDLELFTLGEMLPEITALAGAKGVFTIVSSHDFEKTPPEAEMFSRLQRMQAQGADIAKLAVMPQSPEDVLALLAATLRAKRDLGCLAITMAMGAMGVVSRISGELFGSVVTFGAGEQSSALGQLPAGQLREILEALSYSSQ